LVITLVELKATIRFNDGLKSRARALARRIASAVPNSVENARNFSEPSFTRPPSTPRGYPATISTTQWSLFNAQQMFDDIAAD
jgi:hypothetical protein